MLNIERLSQIIVTVADAEVSRAFYQETLGFEQLFDRDLHDGAVRAIGFRLTPNVVIEVVWINGVVPDPAAAAGPTLAFSVKDIDEAKKTLEAQSIEVFNEMEVDGSRMLFFKDPDGNTLECVQFAGNAQCVSDLYPE